MSVKGRNRQAESNRSFASDVSRIEESLEPLPAARRKAALVLISGLPGSGKSHFSRLLQSRTPLVCLESDRVRQLLFDKPTYEAEESAQVFATIDVVLERLLSRHLAIALDATNLREKDRRKFYAIAQKSAAKLVLISVQAPAKVIRQRLHRRMQRLDPLDISEADIAVYQGMRKRMQAIQRPHIVVDTSQDLAEYVDEVVSQLSDEWYNDEH